MYLFSYTLTTCILHMPREITSLPTMLFIYYGFCSGIRYIVLLLAYTSDERIHKHTWNARGAYTHPINTCEEIKPLL